MKSLFIPYGTEIAEIARLLEDEEIAAVGTNQSNPPWAHVVPSRIKLFTTLDVPREKMLRVSSTVEHAWGLIMAAHRRLPAATALDADQDRNQWLAPYQLKGKALGIIGYGRIGSACAGIARAFGMAVMVCDPNLRRVFTANEVLAAADVTLVSCTLNASSTGLVDPARPLRTNAILVSIAPHSVIHLGSLIVALHEGRLRAAALDDWPTPLNGPHVQELRQQGRLVITPHIGGSTLEARALTERFVREAMAKWLETGR